MHSQRQKSAYTALPKRSLLHRAADEVSLYRDFPPCSDGATARRVKVTPGTSVIAGGPLPGLRTSVKEADQ